MKKWIKRKIIQYRLNGTKKDWQNKDQKRILIQLNDHFTRSVWERFWCRYPFVVEQYEIQYSRNKYELIKLFTQADIAFLYGVSQYLDFSAKPQKKLYLPMSGLDAMNGKRIPQQTQIDTSKGISSGLIAEYVLSMSILIMNNYHIALKNMVRRAWTQNSLMNGEHDAIINKTIGVWGFGNNGKAVADRFVRLGCEVWVTDIQEPEKNYYGERFVPFERSNEILDQADIIVLTVPLSKGTRNMVDKNFLGKIKPDAILINVSRGEVICEPDMLIHLKNHPSFKAVLDVTSKEPLPRNSKLWKNKNVIITPHISGNINRLVEHIQEDFLLKVIGKDV